MLDRPRVLEALNQAHRIVVVRAPAGSGKSVALRQWREHQSRTHRTVWVTAEKTMLSRADFWSAVLEVISLEVSTDDGASHRARELLTDNAPLPSVIAPLLSRMVDTVLIVDAFEQLGGAQCDVADDLLALVDQMPQLRVVVAGRTATNLTTGAVRLRYDVGEVGNRELLFTVDEIRALLELEEVSLTDARLPEVLERATGHGFAIALRASILALRSNATLAAASDLIWKRVVADDLRRGWHEEIVEFVRRTSAAPYFDRDLARELSGVDNYDEYLRLLEAEGLGEWEELPPGVQVFRYTYPVRAVFREELKQAGESLYRTNTTTAAAWLHKHGDADGALELAVESGDGTLINQICRDHFAGVTTFRPELRAQRKAIFEKMPDAERKKWPVVELMLALIYNADPVTRGRGAVMFGRVVTSTRASGQSVPLEERIISRGIITSSLRVMGQVTLAGTTARNTLEMVRRLTPEQRESLGAVFPVTTRQIATSLLVAGHLDLATEANGMALAEAGSREPLQNNYLLSQAAGIYATAGDNHRAARALDSVRPDLWPEGAEDGYPNALGIIARAHLSLDEFRFAEADATLARLDPHLDTIEFWPRITQLHMHAALGLGTELDEALRVQAALETPMPGMGSRPEAERLVAMHAILWLAASRPGKALAVLGHGRLPVASGVARCLHYVVTGDSEKALRLVTRLLNHRDITIRDSASLATVGAAASLRLADRETASHLLTLASHAADDFGTRGQLLFLSAEDRENLAELTRESRSRVMEKLFDGTDALPAPMPFLIGGPRLTRRELVVINAMARVETIPELARVLSVSPNTLKAQLRSIYKKLEVNSRSDAVRRALRLELLHPDQVD